MTTITEPRHSLRDNLGRRTGRTSVLGVVRGLSRRHPERDYTDLRHRIIAGRWAAGYSIACEMDMEQKLADQVNLLRLGQEAAVYDLGDVFTVEAVAGL